MNKRSSSKLHPLAISPASSSSSSSQRGGSLSWAQRNQSNVFRHGTQPKMKMKRKQVLPGGKLQPLFKNHTAPPKLQSIQSSENFSVLPQILCEAQENNSHLEIFCGAVTDFPQLPPATVSIYLCYDVTDMQAEVEALVKTALPELEDFCASLGLAFHLVDPNWTSKKNPEFRRNWSKEQNIYLTECQATSLGPNFVLLMGDRIGEPMLVSELEEAEYRVLSKTVAKNSLSNGHLLTTFYIKDDNSKPPSYLFQQSAGSKAEMEDLRALLQDAATRARDAGKLSDDVIKKYFLSALADDVSAGVLENQNPRSFCLAYRREFQNLPPSAENLANDAAQSQTTSDAVIQLWKNVEKYLGETNAKSYFVKLESDRVEDDDGFRKYLEKFCADFVADVKDLIVRSAEKFPSDLFQLVRGSVYLEALHHASICARKSAFVQGQMELVEVVRQFIRDPKRSNQPFVIYGPPGCGKSVAIANAARSCGDMFSGDCVTVLRFLGTSSDSSNVHDTVASITIQICLAYSLAVPDMAEAFGTLYKALCTFRSTLETVSKNHAYSRPLLVFLDGIDKLNPHSECLSVLWAVKHLPPNVHVVLSSIEQYGNVNFLGALMMLVTSPECTLEVQPIAKEDLEVFVDEYLNRLQRKLSTDQKKMVVDAGSGSDRPLYLAILLDEASRWSSTVSSQAQPMVNLGGYLPAFFCSLEEEFGKAVVKYFISYLSIADVGILDEEMISLMSVNDDVLQELRDCGVSSFPVAMVTELKHRLRGFIEPRLVYGKRGFGWSQREFWKAGAARYDVIIDGASEDQLNADATNFTLAIHEHFVNVYLAKKEFSGYRNEPNATSSSEALANTAFLTRSSGTLLRSTRLAYHMKVLLPVKGLSMVKKHLIFHYEWLHARISSVFFFSVYRDIRSFYGLARHLICEAILDDTISDVGIVLEFLNLAERYVSKDPDSLAVEVLGRLRETSKEHSRIRELVEEAENWLERSGRKVLVPLRPLWTSPGSVLRRTLNGPTHFLGYLRDGEVAVCYSEAYGIDIWRLQTGELLHRFSIYREQLLEGILPGHSAEFVILTHYSNINQLMEFNVWSTETGLLLLNSTFQREFEAVTLDDDDQLVAVATLVQSEETRDLERCILGIAVPTKDIVFRLSTGELHKNGIGKLMFVRNTRRETDSLVSFGRSPSQDLGFWDLSKSCLDFSLDLDCTPKHIRLNSEHKMLVCASPDSGTILIVNLARGVVDQKLKGEDYESLTDIETQGDSVFVTTWKSGILVLSLSQSSSMRVVSLESTGESLPTKLLLSDNGGNLLFVGFDSGAICVFETSSGSDAVLATLRGHTKRVNSLTLTRQGQLLSTADDGVGLLWDHGSLLEAAERKEDGDAKVENGKAGKDPMDDIGYFLVTSDEKRIVSGSRSGTVAIWDIKSGDLIKTIAGFEDLGIDYLYFVRNEELLIGHCFTPTMPNARVLQVWDLQKGEVMPLDEDGGRVLIYCSAVTPSGDRLVTIRPCKDNGEIGIVLGVYDLLEMKALTDLICNIYGTMDAQNLRIVGFSPQYGSLETVTIETDKAKRKKSKRKGLKPEVKKLHLVLDYFPKPSVSFFFTFTISGENLDEIVVDSNEPIRIDTIYPECSFVVPNEICVTGSTIGKIVSWNIRSQEIKGEFLDASLMKPGSKDLVSSSPGRLAHNGPVTCVVVDWKKGMVVSGGQDQKVKLWNLFSQELLTTFNGHQGDILTLSFCLDYSMVVSSSADDTLCVWKFGKSTERLCAFSCHGNVTSVLITGDKQRVVGLLSAEGAGGGSRLFFLRSVNL